MPDDCKHAGSIIAQQKTAVIGAPAGRTSKAPVKLDRQRSKRVVDMAGDEVQARPAEE